MPTNSGAESPEGSADRLSAATGWHSAGLVAVIASVWVVVCYTGTFKTMLGMWWNSATFAHGLVVYPIAGWLIWRARPALMQLQPQPCYWALLPMAACGLGWLVATAGGVQAGQHLCAAILLAMVPWAILGTNVARVIAFPLLFTIFGVPIGDFMLPTLMEHTADFTVVALRLTGIPVYREGLTFAVPSGQWSVVEACSGLRYLIASMMLGSLFAYLTYRSMPRRLAFIGLSIVVPIVANWVRAYMIVIIGHLSEMKLAVGIDHLIYGWLFFGFVMFLLFWIGTVWREDLRPSGAVETAASGIKPVRSGVFSTWIGGVAVALVVVVWPLYEHMLTSDKLGAPVKLEAPIAADGWNRLASLPSTFRPHFMGDRAHVDAAYANADLPVVMYMGYYHNQSHGNELIAFDNAIVRTADRQWTKIASGQVQIPPEGVKATETQVRQGGQSFLVWHCYWIGGQWTTSEEEAKLLQALMVLIGRGDDAAVVVLHTPIGNGSLEQARSRLSLFSKAMLRRIDSSLSAAKSRRVAPAAER